MSNFMGKEDKVLIDLKLKELPEKEENKKLLAKIIELENKLLQKEEEIKMLNKKFEEIEKRIEKIENNAKIEKKVKVILLQKMILILYKKI